ncbi:MAG: helix-turn-helix domain-containing protein [Candidatus Paceibacterota bacterium]|jgi:excisionase family DNA binding protein
MDKKDFLSTSELAKILGISRIAVYKRIKAGKIKAKRIGRDFIIDKKDLGNILGKELTKEEKTEIEKAVKKTVEEYGETLKLLGST